MKYRSLGVQESRSLGAENPVAASAFTRGEKARSGFSLLEVLIAITIVVILGAAAGLFLLDAPQKANVARAKMDVNTLKTAVTLYAAENSAPPTQRQGLEALVVKTTIPPIPANFPSSGYLDTKKIPLDPWGRPYAYLVPGRGGEAFEIISYGRDGEEGGEGFDADISSSKPQ